VFCLRWPHKACAVQGLVHGRDAVYGPDMSLDPVDTNPEHYRVVLENEKVRVLEFTDQPGDKTAPHRHPDSVIVALTPLRRRITSGGRAADVVLQAGQTWWLDADEHAGENTADFPTHLILVELKQPGPAGDRPAGAGEAAASR
jgi:quercetin dioxygenase-like cupin family protein